MILKNNASEAEFLKEIENKKLYCFGAGRVFQDFLMVHKNIHIYSVIDRNADILKEKYENISFIKPDEFICECDDKNSVLLITCFDFEEIQNELRNEKSLNNLSCYVYFIMQEFNGIEQINEQNSKYQLTEFRYQDCMAGQKAPADVAVIASKLGYSVLTLNRGTLASGMEQTEQSWKCIADGLKENSILILQLPLADDTEGIYKILTMKKEKKVKIIGIIHDVNILRGNPTDYDFRQYKVLKELPDVLIVHNKYMMKELYNKGFDINKMVNLEIFDYLMPSHRRIQISDGIVIAGNLMKSKAAYVYQINKIQGVSFNLFGANYIEKNSYSNINYFGAFLPDDLINNLQGKYGLVWDGNSIETCSGGKGEYLRINNPHKLSLYLAVGIPVIIWDEAAEAEFVIKEHVGITVKSLYDLPDKLAAVSDSEYENMKHNAEAVGERLRSGEYMTNAIRKAELIIQDIREN